MNAREISEVSLKLKSIINAVEQGALREIAGQIESAALTPYGMYDSAVRGSMQRSKDRNGYYEIHTDDIESIKSIKAVINLLRSADAATGTLIRPLLDGVEANLNATSKLQAVKSMLGGVTGLASEYVSAKWTDMRKPAVPENDGVFNLWNKPTETRIDQGLRLVGDVTAMKFYVGQLVTLLPELANLSNETKQTITKLQGVLNETAVMNVATVVQGFSDSKNAMGGALDLRNAAANKAGVTGLDRTLEAVRDAAASAISAEDREKYYDKKDDKYRMPARKESVTSPLPASQNLMVAYNLSVRSGKTLARINAFMDDWKKTEEFPISQVPAMIELINKVGKMVKDFQKLDNSELSQLIKQDMARAIKEVLAAIGPNLPQLAAIAQEAELRIGLRDNYLLSNLEGVAAQFESIAKKFDVPVTTRYPYPEQKKAVIQKLKGEGEQRMRDLDFAKMYFDGRKYDVVPSLVDLEYMLKHASNIRTPNGAAFQAAVQLMAKQITGMDKLEIDINKAETKLYQLSQLPESERKANHAELEKQALADVKELYAIRTLLQANIDKPGSTDMQYYVSTGSGVGNIMMGYAINSLPKSFKTAANAAAADIDGLMQAEKNNLVRLDNLAVKNKVLLGATEEVKQDRMRALQTMRGSTIGDARAKIAVQRTSREQGYANLQKKVRPPDDNDILQGIIERKRGAPLVQSEKARIAMIDQAKSYLSDSQFDALGNTHKKDGIYEMQPGDGLLVMNIKQMSNTMARLEKLMTRVNQASEYMAAGAEAYGNMTFSVSGVMNAASNVAAARQAYGHVAGLIPLLKEDIISLLQEVQAANAALVALRESLGNTATGEMNKVLGGILEGINKNFPTKLIEILTDAQTEILSAIDPAYAEKAKELFTEANKFLINVDHLVRRGHEPTTPLPAPKSPDVEVSTVNKAKGVINTMVSILQKKLEESPATKKRFGSQYDLSKLDEGSPEKVMAGLANAMMSLNASLDATVLITRTKGIMGGGDLVANLYKMFVALKATSPSALAIVQPQIKALLESFEPVISALYASAAITEKTMGLREGSLTASLGEAAKLFQDQATKFDVSLKDPAPFYAAQLALAEKEIKRLQDQRAQPGTNTTLLDVQIEKITQIKESLTEQLAEKKEPARMGPA